MNQINGPETTPKRKTFMGLWGNCLASDNAQQKERPMRDQTSATMNKMKNRNMGI